MDIKEKERHMVDWWSGNMEIFKQMGIKRDDFGRMVMQSRLLFRYGMIELLHKCHLMNLPLYVVSGGISEIIEACFYAILHNGEAEHHGESELRSFWHNHA
jgi:2-hydroxy-3-keto-5-methylthiopentenyl-1-phosphate phosphatase